MKKIDVLVTGGTGKVGSQALKSLLARKTLKVRALVRNPAKAQWIADMGGELVEGDLDDIAAVNRAMEGVQTLALITPAGAPTAESLSSPGIGQVGHAKCMRMSQERIIPTNTATSANP